MRSADYWVRQAVHLYARRNYLRRPAGKGASAVLAHAAANVEARGVRSFRVEDRIAAANDFVEAGYEVNVNFGPVIVKEGRQRDYIELFGMLDATLSQAAQAELAAEVIFLTRSEELREVNPSWHPKGRGCSGVRRSRRRRSRRQAATGCFAAKRGSNAASCESSGLRLRG